MDDTVTFADWARIWLKTYKLGNVKDNSYDGTYRGPTELHLIPYFGSALLTSIRPAHVQQFFDIKSKKYSLESLKKMKGCLHSIFETAIDNELCYRNPVTRTIKLKSSIPPAEKRSYTLEQYQRVHAFISAHPDGLAIQTILETGITRSELLGLRWEDLDVEKGVLYIRQGLVQQKNASTGKVEVVSDGLKNAHRRRAIPISDELTAKLAAIPRVVHIAGRGGISPRDIEPPTIFYSPRGLPYSPVNWTHRVYEPFMEAMHEAYPDIPVLTAHELRHTRATLWKDAGVDLFSLARALGHSDLDMLSKRYAHDNLDTLRKALSCQNPPVPEG